MIKYATLNVAFYFLFFVTRVTVGSGSTITPIVIQFPANGFPRFHVEVPISIPIVFKWYSSNHPVYITSDSNVEWTSSEAIYTMTDFDVIIDSVEQTTKFTIPLSSKKTLYFFCKNHENMGVNEFYQISTPRQSIFDINPYSKIQPTKPFTLLNLDECNDISEEFAGVFKSENSQVMDLTNSKTISGDIGQPDCTLTTVYFDSNANSPVYTVYDTYISQNGMIALSDIWEFNVKLSTKQTVVVVSCQESNNEQNRDAVPPKLKADTDFSFILKLDSKLSIEVLKCLPGFCFLTITSEMCLRPQFAENGIFPYTIRNLLTSIPQKMTIISLGLSTAYMNIIQTPPDQGEPIITGFSQWNFLNVSQMSGALNATCINQENKICTLQEANVYGSDLMILITTSLGFDGMMVKFDDVVVDYSRQYGFLVNYKTFIYMPLPDNTLKRFIDDFRSCPKFTVSTGSYGYLYENNVYSRIKCKLCQINTYYNEIAKPPLVTKTQKTMYVNKLESINEGFKTTTYTISAFQNIPPASDKKYAESIIDIGTDLTLITPDPSILSIVEVECEGRPIVYTRTSATQISIKIQMEYSGKLILVHIADTEFVAQLPDSRGRLSRVPVYIIPRAGEIVSSCIQCPEGTFSGSYSATDVSDCKSKNQNALALRRLLSAGQLTINPNNAGTWIQVKDKIIIVLEIKDKIPKNKYDFSLEIYLQYSDIIFLQENMVLLLAEVMKIYNHENVPVILSSSLVKIHLSKVFSFFEINGKFGNSTISKYVPKKAADSFEYLVVIASSSTAVIIISIVAVVLSRRKHAATNSQSKSMPHLYAQSPYCPVCSYEPSV